MPGPPTPLMGQLRHLFCTTSSSVPGGMKPHLPQYNLPEEHPFCTVFPSLHLWLTPQPRFLPHQLHVPPAMSQGVPLGEPMLRL